MKRIHTFLAMLCFCGIVSAAHANHPAQLVVGDRIPPAFGALNAAGAPTDFAKIKGEQGAILIFTRSADWCQYCKIQLKEWNKHVERFGEEGYHIASISYDSPEKLNAFKSAQMIGYTMLSDTGSAMIEAFGIRNKRFDEGSRFYGIPNPAIYVFDARGEITHVFREEDYQDRPEVEEVFSAIKRAE